MLKTKENQRTLLAGILLILGLIIPIITCAASFSVSTSKSSVTAGDSFTVSIGAGGLTGSFGISVENGTANISKVWIERGAAEKTITVKTSNPGTTRVTITAKNVETEDGTSVTGSKTASVTVKEKSSGGSSGGSSNNGGSTSGGGSTSNSGSGSTSGGNSSSNNNNNSNDTSTNSNALLKMIKVSPVDFSGFKPTKYSGYSVTVENDVTEVSVKATPQVSGAKVAISGDKDLKEGKNTVSIVVTAKDGKTKKTYTVEVNRLAAGEEATETTEGPEGQEETTSLLSNLTIQNVNLTPAFSPDIYEYTVEVGADVLSLPIEALPVDEGTKVEVLGNENFVDGENIVTILLTSEDGKQTTTYQIKVMKNMQPVVSTTNNEDAQKNFMYMIIFDVCTALVAIAGITFAIIEYRHGQKQKEEPRIFEENFLDKEEMKEPKLGYVKENTEKKTTVDDLFNIPDEEDEKPNKKGKGKHF